MPEPEPLTLPDDLAASMLAEAVTAHVASAAARRCIGFASTLAQVADELPDVDDEDGDASLERMLLRRFGRRPDVEDCLPVGGDPGD